jgi:hypothetical protein
MSPRKKAKPCPSEDSLIDNIQHFVPRKIPSQNVTFRLMMRELHGGASAGRGFGRDHHGRAVSTSRGFFLNVFPNYTLVFML